MATTAATSAAAAAAAVRRPIWRRIKGLLSRGVGEAEPPLYLYERGVDEWKDPNKPIVLVFGYGSAPRKINEKYTEAYRKFGIPGVSFTSEFFDECIPAPYVVNPLASIYKKLPDEAYKQLPQEFESLHKRKIIIHALSMNGARTVAAFYNYAMANNIPIQERVIGLLFDSTPSTLPMWMNVWGQLLTVKKEICDLPRFVRFPFLFPRGFKHCVLREYYRKFNPEKLKHHNLFDFLNCVCPLPRTQMYVYSMDDNIVHYSCIEKFLNYQKEEMKKDVDVLMFPQSPHVKHLEANRKKYERTLEKFIKKSVAAAGIDMKIEKKKT